MSYSTTPRHRHYHVEDCDVDATLSPPIASFRKAKSEAYQYVQHARRTGIWQGWHVTWSDREAGYHRWSAQTKLVIGVYIDTITVVPCSEAH